MTKPVCVPCARFYRPHHNGRPFIEGMPKGGAGVVPHGKGADAYWTPYKLWLGDEWICDGCGSTIIIGTPPMPMSERHMPTFRAVCEEADKAYGRGKELLQVNDC